MVGPVSGAEHDGSHRVDADRTVRNWRRADVYGHRAGQLIRLHQFDAAEHRRPDHEPDCRARSGIPEHDSRRR